MQVPATVMFEHGSVNALARHLSEVSAPRPEAAEPHTAEAETSTARSTNGQDGSEDALVDQLTAADDGDVEQLSQDDLIEMLEAELNQLGEGP
jgi:hypothetical protein